MKSQSFINTDFKCHLLCEVFPDFLRVHIVSVNHPYMFLDSRGRGYSACRPSKALETLSSGSAKATTGEDPKFNESISG